MNEGDRQAPQRACRVLAAIADFALVQSVDAGENFDQRRFARAVLAQKRDNLSGLEAHADIVERLGAAERLRHAAHDEQFDPAHRGARRSLWRPRGSGPRRPSTYPSLGARWP